MHLYGPNTFIFEKNVENSYFGHLLLRHDPAELKYNDEPLVDTKIAKTEPIKNQRWPLHPPS